MRARTKSARPREGGRPPRGKVSCQAPAGETFGPGYAELPLVCVKG
ncbi:MAG TPA: hypothetical protein VFH22_05115 [Rhodocyclaceae bacterium]|nr:hypothetical protein [Rhodocyclaceae bacterium]